MAQARQWGVAILAAGSVRMPEIKSWRRHDDAKLEAQPPYKTAHH